MGKWFALYYYVQGLNFNKFLKVLEKNEIKILYLKRSEYNSFCIGIKHKDKKKFLEVVKDFNYTKNIVKRGFILNLLNFFKKNFATSICVIIILPLIFISSNFVFNVKIYGLEKVSLALVEKVLNENGFNSGKTKSSYNLKEVERCLKNNIKDISLASATIFGNTLIVNIKEKIDLEKYLFDFQPIKAPFDLIIENVNLISGTCLKNSGDIVKKGETIVEPYIFYKDGTRLKVEANANIKAKIQISNLLIYEENHEELVLSGKQCFQKKYSLFNWCFKETKLKENYLDYKVEKKEQFLFNTLLPIKEETYFYYELVKTKVNKPFDEEQKQNLICENKNLLYNQIERYDVDKNDISYENYFNELDGKILLTTYLKTTIVF